MHNLRLHDARHFAPASVKKRVTNQGKALIHQTYGEPQSAALAPGESGQRGGHGAPATPAVTAEHLNVATAAGRGAERPRAWR
jgi:hypothetical protein